VEHAVMHLLYARFFVKALRDLKLLDFDEPFVRLFNQGTIVFQHRKMSKSRGNVVAPDAYVERVGADTVRSYLMFLGPWEQGGEWSDSGINGVARWLNRVWELAQRDSRQLDLPVAAEAARDTQRLVHKTVRKVTDDVERFKFNTALAALMEYTNTLSQVWEGKEAGAELWDGAIERLLVLMAPMAPHVSEELWERTGHESSIHDQSWPEWDPELAAEEVVTLVVQVDGRLRDRIEVPVSITEDEARQTALESGNVQRHTDGKEISRVIYVPGKLVNIVTR